MKSGTKATDVNGIKEVQVVKGYKRKAFNDSSRKQVIFYILEVTFCLYNLALLRMNYKVCLSYVLSVLKWKKGSRAQWKMNR